MAATEPQSIWGLNAPLLEGPLWNPADQALWFVCIKTPAIYRLDPESGARQSWRVPQQIGFIVPVEGTHSFVTGLQDGLHLFNPADGSFKQLANPEAHLPRNRLNDATTDAQGRLWFGTMGDMGSPASGYFYRFDGSGVHALAGPVAITNGPAVSPDGRILYHVDTLAGDIFASDILPDGSLGEPRLFVHIPTEEGYPDGPTVDSEGHLWVGLFYGGAARRYAPDSKLVETVSFPVSSVTKIAFGGPDLRTAYATTSAGHLDADGRAREPLAGNLFSFRVDVPGLPTPAVRLD
ncbi:MAG: gluconolaconase [Sphingomonas sp.]|nr:MAG: gluconolaconase [Sphingomonas sp.]